MKKTNELKKGTRVRLRSGWEADLEDNAKGNTRMAKVYGDFTEIGSVYAHDIIEYQENGLWQIVVHTDAQKKLRETVGSIFG
jgi:hypothetical protein